MSLLLLFGGDGSQTVTAQVASLTLTPVAGTVTGGAATQTAQVATLTLTAIEGVVGEAPPQTITAQVATLTLTAIAGTVSGGAATQTAQTASLTLTPIAGTLTPGAVTITAQIASLTLTPVAGVATITVYGGEVIGIATATTDVAGTGIFGVKARVETDEWATMHPVIEAAMSLTAGSGDVLAGDYGFRGLFTFHPHTDDPTLFGYAGPWALYTPDTWFTGDEGGATILAEWGDFKLTIGRVADGFPNYKLELSMLTALAEPITATAYIQIEDDVALQIGLGVTRDVTTGQVQLWRSDDLWVSWNEIPLATSTTPSGALPDSLPGTITLLSANWSNDTTWVEIFQAQWAESDTITDFDAFEVAAWNYGPNVDGTITATIMEDAILAVETDLAYIQAYSVVNGGRTIEGDFTVNVPSNNTSAPPAATSGQFVYSSAPVLQDGPGQNTTGSAIVFTGMSSGAVTYSEETLAPTIALTRSLYRLILLRPDGTQICALDKAVLTDVTWELNGIGSFEFEMANLDPDIVEVRPPDREVQVWRGDTMLHWGVVVRAQGNASTVTFQCRGLGWYFTKRIVGAAETNFIHNGSFESDRDYWWTGTYSVLEWGANRDPNAWVAQVTSTRPYTGSKSLYHYSEPPLVYGIYSYQWFTYEVDPLAEPEGVAWTAVAWAYIPSDQWVDERKVSWDGGVVTTGLTIFRASMTEFTNGYIPGVGPITLPKLIEEVTIPITVDTPRDVWVRFEAELLQPVVPGTTEWIQVMLGTPVGAVYWDEVTLVRNEQLYFNDVDQALIVDGLVQHAQDPAYGKNDLRIGTHCEGTGIKRTRVYPFYNHELISDALDEFPELWQGMDWEIRLPSRVFTTYYPMKGSRRPAQSLELGRNIADLTLAVDGEQTANRLVVMADTDSRGAGREEEYATDTTALDDGLILEMASNSIPETSIPTLRAQVERGVRRYRSPVKIATVKSYEKRGAELIGKVNVGDVVRITADIGWVSVDADYRIIQMKLDPQTDTVDFTVNPFEEWNDPYQAWEIQA